MQPLQLAQGKDGRVGFKEAASLVLHVPVEDPEALGLALAVEETGGDATFPAVMIREGIFTPAIGNPGSGQRPARIRFRAEVIERLAPTMDRKKVNLEHFQDIDNEVGFVKDAHFDDNVKGLRGNLVLQKIRAKFVDALAFVKGRQQAKKVPNVSIELKKPVFRIAEPEEQVEFDLDLVDGEFDGCSLVTVGACNDEDGCGIGLAGLGLEGTIHGKTKPAGEDGHVHEFWVTKWKDSDGKKHTSLWTTSHDRGVDGLKVSHSHTWQNAAATSVADGHAHDLPEGLADQVDGLGFTRAEPVGSFTVLAHEGTDTNPEVMNTPDNNPDNESCTCGGKDNVAGLKAKVTELKAQLAEKEAALAKASEDLSAAEAQVSEFQEAKMSALREQVVKAMPEGADIEEVLGCKAEEASEEALTVCLRAWGGNKDQTRVGLGRHTQAGDRDRPNARTVDLDAQRERLGLSKESRLPKSMERNTRTVLALKEAGKQ